MEELIARWRGWADKQQEHADNEKLPESTRLAGAAVASNLRRCADQLEHFMTTGAVVA